MKCKNIYLILLFLSFVASSFAQHLGGGLMLGPTFSTMKISGNDSTTFRTDFTGK